MGEVQNRLAQVDDGFHCDERQESGVSAYQFHRALDVTYLKSWLMCHHS